MKTLVIIIVSGIKNQINNVCNIEKTLNSFCIFIFLIKSATQNNRKITNIGFMEVLYEK